MKLKKRYIALIVLVLLIPLLFIFKRKNVEINDVNNKNNKLAPYIFNKNETIGCEQWINVDLLNSGYGVVFKNDKYIVLDAKITNLKTSTGQTGYSGYAFIEKSTGCAVTTDYVNNSLGGIATSCSEIREHAITSNWGNIYNNFVDSGYCTEKIEIASTCSIKWDMDESNGFEGAYFQVNGNSYSLEDYINNCGCGNNLNNFIATAQKNTYEEKCGVSIPENNKCSNISITDSFGNKRNTFYFNGLVQAENCSSWESNETEQDGTDNIGAFYYYKGNENNSKCYYSYNKETTGKMCNYVYDTEKNWNLYLVDGCTYDLTSYLTRCNSLGENKCGDPGFKNFLIEGMNKNNWYSNHINIYNSNCSDKINYGTVIVYQNDDSYGLDCNKNGWEYNETGSCKRSATNGTINGPNVDNLTKYGTRKFIGWSTNKNCSPIERTTNTFDVNFTGTKTYYACFEGTSTTSALFENDNKKVIDIKYVNENEHCSDTDTKITNTYYRKTTEIEPYKSKLRGNNTIDTWDDINPYCNVVCEDDVKVSYPSIFETVPAGQYFELMYEPEITATRTCTSEFNYDKWKRDYGSAVTAERAAMTALNKAKANLEAAKKLSSSGIKGSCCLWGSCSGEGCVPPCIEYYRYDSKIEKYYTDTLIDKINGDTQNASGCGSSAYTSNRGDTIIDRRTDKRNALNAYKLAVTQRIKLEQKNYQCYTILDQDVNNKKYSDVFNQNYEYGNDLKVNDTIYNLKTPLVSAPTLNSSTSPTYAIYIGKAENGGITTTTLQQLNNSPIGTTVNFYAVYPKLTFQYDAGSKGMPNDLNDFKNNILLEIANPEEILTPEAHVKLDTGSFTPNDSNSYTKDDLTTIPTGTLGHFYVDGVEGNHINFYAYNAKTTTRQVQYYFTYREPTEYYSKKHNGAATTIKPTGEAYISLTKKEKLTKKDNSETAVLNHVYPVELKAVEGNYYNGIILSNYQNMTRSNTNSNSYFGQSIFGSDFKGKYVCDYNVTNDALKLSKEKQTFRDLKSNTIFRSVATNNIDPNDRNSTGNLGENWLNAKGSAVRTIIESKERHDGVTNDTYNENNLEYSFTLTPKIINAIKGINNPTGYNALTNYDDFNLECTEDGRECISVFLTYLSEGKVLNPSSIKFKTNSNNIIDHSLLSVKDTYSNYSSLNSWNSDDLDDIRKQWKYYIGDTNASSLGYGSSDCEEIDDTNLAICKPNIITLDVYNKLYETWGVLP